MKSHDVGANQSEASMWGQSGHWVGIVIKAKIGEDDICKGKWSGAAAAARNRLLIERDKSNKKREGSYANKKEKIS